ncbi:KxYKxGKxW signal peptide domain-containing protein [Weissella confusa]|uniref:KxYKxGKxW signal peptide domain-containing protein n=1 Tax=Weissella confusa TaxID=1583 RepID=A0A923NEJ5_WEICO|nr:KxYKxGKxW signal peptide domain-containing protein [Weissella confusa]
MSREDYQQKLADEARVQPQTHKKMYKSKKRWVIAGMTALAVERTMKDSDLRV